MNRKVIVYTTPTCGYCQQTKRFLAENGVEYQEVDVSNDEGAALEVVRRTNQYSVPVIEIDGTLIVGFDRARLERLLKTA
ncbi:MAG: glutaredoxin family protein [Chloroflexi bacterium]|nr:glutaredoxin family protein [Chloroflexota bacterium]